MKKIVKRVLGATLAASIVMLNCGNVMAADKSVSYSELMADEEVHSGADDNIDIEAEEIFGVEKATTNIDSSSKKSDNSDSKKTSKSETTAKKTTKADDTPKTGLEETPAYIPILFLSAAAAAMLVAGVNIFGRKRRIEGKR
ncbi:MAG: hypothetical protein HFH14_04170 [Lachnospiraceae bacterium]|nr:hypothetical protein [Lachnospiraceae bacterium]